MAYVALYRQWRPQDFENLVGQDHVSQTLKNAIQTGKIAHAYLFAGPRGTGKTSTAKILAKALNCVQGPTALPCNNCSGCTKITTGTSMDVFEIDAASNRGIDEIRDLRETVKFSPVDGRYKVYIIDEVHMLTTEAFNALLKTLEEPPGHVVFILATTEAHKIPATIHSRCQRYDFRRIDVSIISERLSEVAQGAGLLVDDDAVRIIAVHAEGGLRDALSILDQCAAGGDQQITAEKVRQQLGLIGQEWVWKLTDALAAREAGTALLILDELLTMGKDVRQVLLELAEYFRSLMLHQASPGLVEANSEQLERLEQYSAVFPYDELVALIQALHEASNEAKWSPQPRIAAETALLSACRRHERADAQGLIERIEALERKLAAIEAVGRSGGAFSRPEKRQTESARPVKPASPVVQVEKPPTSLPEHGDDRVKNAPVDAGQADDITHVWDSLLKELLASGKRSVHACVAQGQLVSLSNQQAVIAFQASFPKERTEKADYRAILENILQGVCGHAIQVQCTLGAAASAAPIKVQVEVVKQDAQPEQHPALQQAVKMFGGEIVKQE